MAETAVRFAAIIESSLTIKETAKRLKKTEGVVRQMIARRTLYSVLLDNRRFIPIFQFAKDNDDELVADITKVNVVLRPGLHPVEVFEWYTEPDAELYVNDDIDQPVSPLAWLNSGKKAKALVTLAKRL